MLVGSLAAASEPTNTIVDPTANSGYWEGTQQNDLLIYVGSNNWNYEIVDGLGGIDTFDISANYDASLLQQNACILLQQ